MPKKVQQNMATRGSYVHNVSFMQFPQKIDGFRQNYAHGF